MSSQSQNNSEQLITRKQAAEHLGIKEQTLACWASAGRYDLPFYKIGRTAKYKLSDVQAFVNANRQGTGQLS